MKSRLQIVLPFIVGVIAIVALMPHGSRFKYDFINGKEWRFPTLVAEFDFPLYKTDAELSKEQASLRASFVPYYQRDSAVALQQINMIAAEYQHTFNSGMPNEIFLCLRHIYHKGIRNYSSVAESYLDSGSYIYVVAFNVARIVPVSETFTILQAVRYLGQQIVGMQSLTEEQRQYSQSVDWAAKLLPNIVFDDVLTAAAKRESMKMLSPTCGMVFKGERIISDGDIINGEKFRKLQSYRREYELQFGFSGNIWLLLLGQMLLAALLMFALLAYLYFSHRSQLSLKNNSFLVLIIVLFMALSRWTTESADISIYIVPYALLATYICTFMGISIAIVVHVIAVLLASVVAPAPFGFILTNILTGMAAIFYAKKSYRRSSLYRCAITIFALLCLLHVIQLLFNDGSILEFSPLLVFQFALNAGLVIAGYQLIFTFEKMFGFISNTTLIEITDTNHPLLRLLAEKASATFQHCVQVANLAETAIGKIGGNPLLVRAGALYHDIGKLQNPSYFIENQLRGYNPHTQLSPEESAQIIINHVSDGVNIARKYHLPQAIIDFISTHHGKSKTRYFYRIYKEMHPAATDFSAFSYNGDNPTTTEQAVLMLSDVVEASSRTLISYSAQNINQIVETTIDNVVADGVLNQSPLTFADITSIKTAFKKKLQNIYHARMV
jgi:putative nucleotidyltransferase with HDIG domain